MPAHLTKTLLLGSPHQAPFHEGVGLCPLCLQLPAEIGFQLDSTEIKTLPLLVILPRDFCSWVPAQGSGVCLTVSPILVSVLQSLPREGLCYKHTSL